MKFKKDSKSIEANSELRILAEYNRRFKQMRITQKKANKLRDMEMDKEAEKFQELVKMLLGEIEAYYKKYRKVLTKYGTLPEPPLEVEITKEERDIATAWKNAHRKKYGI